MNENPGPLRDPTLNALFFFLPQGGTEQEALISALGLSARTGLAEQRGPDGGIRLSGPLPNGMRCTIASSLAHDTQILHVRLQRSGPQPSGTWGKQKKIVMAWMDPEGREGTGPIPWAATWIYHAALPLNFTAGALIPDLTDPAGPALTKDRATQFNTLSVGWFLCGRDRGEPLVDGGRYPQRELILLTPEDRAERVRKIYLDSLVQGFPRIELYLHKSRHHAQQQAAVREQLGQARAELQESMRISLQTTEFSRLHREPDELERISARLMQFQTQKAYAEVLLNTLRVNVRSFEDHLERVKLRAKNYDHELANFQRHIEQLENDLQKAQTVAESTYTFQDLQRSAEASRFERAGFLMGSTAALLAGIAIFNSFLDIWSLSIDGTSMVLPPTGLRILLGLLAGVSWPLAAYGIVERSRSRALLWIAIGLATVVGAVVATILYN